jgi:YegS/Rv2252/BmrU family lipid kinase
VNPLLIVNPASSGGRTGRIWPDLRRTIEQALGSCEVEMTRAPAHAIEIARQAKGFDRIISVGGDGTFSEVAAGVIEGGHGAAVGIIHQGTGGDYRKTLGIENRLDAYLGAIGRGQPRVVDVARAEYRGHDGQTGTRVFANAASIGMGGLVDKYVAEGSHMLGARAQYFMGSLKALINVAVGRIVADLELAEGKQETIRFPTRIVAVCNGQYFGGGMQIAPMATLDDGILEVLVFAGENRLPLLTAMNSVYSGQHVKHAAVHHYRVKSITLRLENDDEGDRFLLDVDGECLGRAPIKISVIPKALNVLA